MVTRNFSPSHAEMMNRVDRLTQLLSFFVLFLISEAYSVYML